jgi:hypothetical protein
MRSMIKHQLNFGLKLWERSGGTVGAGREMRINEPAEALLRIALCAGSAFERLCGCRTVARAHAAQAADRA